MTATERIAQMGLEHYRSSADFQREQVEAMADVLNQIIEIVGFIPGPPYDEPLFQSFVSVPRLLDHIRGLSKERASA